MTSVREFWGMHGCRGGGWRSASRSSLCLSRLSAAPLYGSRARGLRLVRRTP